ncbi:SpaH/EbpB family LPXTG-anchored major pilin [Coprococcus catus]
MKHANKFASLLLVLVMVFAMGTTAFAAGEAGSITIDNAVVGQTYTIYQILDLESYNASTNAYAYKATTAWNTFINSDAIKGTYVEVDAQGYVTWKDGADAAAFAKAAQKYAKDNSITNQGSVTATTTTVSFTGLDLGYYLVDTTLGSLCSLDTTNPSVVMEEKNEVPVPDKTVKEDSSDKYGESNTAQIGDTVEFKTVIHAKKGAQNYKLHDQMEAGLTLNKDSIKVTVGDAELTKGVDYTVDFDVECKDSQGNDAVCDFEITFSNVYLDTITADTDIVVTYSAVLNKDAEIADATNDNDTRLDYGDNSHSEWDKTTTKTFMFDIIKTDSSLKVLNGAKFELYDAQTGGNKIALVKESEGVYRVATTTEKAVNGFESAVIEAGRATVKGLDANTTYWLEETEAPAGYNKLSGRVKVEMKEGNLTTNMTGDTWADGNGGVQITNNTGAELPSTGGMGTTIFYIIGSVLVLAAIVLLIVRKRMSDR